MSSLFKITFFLRWNLGGAVLRWHSNRTGRPLFPHKFIKRTFERWANSRKQLLNASRGHQAPRKAAHCLLKEVVQNIKHKKRDKRGRDGDLSQEGSLKREVSKHQETLTSGSVGSFGISEGNIMRRKNKKNPQITSLTATPRACICHQQAGTEQGGTSYIA